MTAEPPSVGWVAEALRVHEEQDREEDAPGGRRGSPQPLPGTVREELVLERIDRARRSRPRVREERITMSHGAGGKATQTLIEAIFLEEFRNPLLEPLEDAARLEVGGARLSLTTDSYVVSPLFFPGGSIGDLAVNGTVNDLAMSGATPLFLSAGFILEEGFPVADLAKIVAGMRKAADAAGVQVVTGDTKVVERGKADGCYINTAGVGALEHDLDLGVANAQPGDAIIVSGQIGDHGVTIMLARGELDIEADVTSDTAPLNGLVAGLLSAAPGVRALRDATRGGVATILNEIAKAANVGVLVNENDIPVRPEVRGAAELLGIDPMYVACEGRLVAVVQQDQADQALAALRAHPLGEQAAVIGRVTADPPGIVQLKTAFGGTRIVDLLVGDPLPQDLLSDPVHRGAKERETKVHELAITESVVDAVTERLPGARVTCVRLEIGALSGVVADSVRFCFDLVTEGTNLEGARLEITETAGRCHCRVCGSDFEPDGPIAICPCGSIEISVMAGEELKIQSVQVA